MTWFSPSEVETWIPIPLEFYISQISFTCQGQGHQTTPNDFETPFEYVINNMCSCWSVCRAHYTCSGRFQAAKILKIFIFESFFCAVPWCQTVNVQSGTWKLCGFCNQLCLPCRYIHRESQRQNSDPTLLPEGSNYTSSCSHVPTLFFMC